MKKLTLLFAFSFLLGLHFVGAQQYPFDVKIYGSGEPVLLVPGFACPGEVWESTIHDLKDHYELHVFTLAGFGGQPPVEFPWLPKIKEGMEDYIRNNKLGNGRFVGHSMGGTLGLWLASDNPEMFKVVISVDGLPAMGAVMFPDYNPENFVYDSPFNQQTLAMDEAGFAAMARQMAGGMTGTESKKSVLTDWIKQTDRETYVYGYTDLLKTDLRKDLGNIRSKVVVIAATNPFGAEVVRDNIRKQFEDLDEYTLILADNSAHFIMFDKPEWLNDTLKEHLKAQ